MSDQLILEIKGLRLVDETPKAWIVEAGAGEVWHDAVAWTLDQGMPGLENLALIPGTVGAAPVQNIGAYGLELADRFDSLDGVDLVTGRGFTLDRRLCRFGYRDSVFKQPEGQGLAIVDVTFALPRDWQPNLRYATDGRTAAAFALACSQAGVPLVQALTVVAQTVDNAFIGSRIEQMRDGIERGESISRCAAATGVFTPVVLQMINVGEETGELDNLLFEIAAMYERDTDYSIKGLSASIEPILLAVIGVLVLLLALGVFLPLWNMGQAAMGRGGG